MEDSDNIVDIFPSRKWRVRIEDYELTGRPDAKFLLQDGTCLIVDYKTAPLTPTQDELLPFYEVQLNAYKYLVECEKLKVKALSLVYLEPIKYAFDLEYLSELNSEKLTLRFHCTAKSVKNWENRDIEELVKEVGKILSSAYPPEGNPECEHCKGLSEWLSNLSKIVTL